MKVLLLALPGSDATALRASLAPALGASALDVCQTVEAAVTWLENRPCDLIAVAGAATTVVEGLARLRQVSRTLPLLAVLGDAASPDAGAAWLAGANDVITVASLSSATLPEGLDDVRHPERDVLRRTQRLWYAGVADALRQQLGARLGSRLRDVGLTGEGLAGLTTQDVESLQSAALVVNALAQPHALVIGVRRVKRMYPSLAITVVVEGLHHDAFKRAGADECVPAPVDADHVLHAVGRAQATCRTSQELDTVRARETRLRALLEQLPEAVVLVSPEHTVLAVNHAALRLVGAHDARQVLGSRLTPWVETDGSEEGIALLLDGVASGTARDVVAATRQLPEPRRLLLRAVPFQRESGGPPAALIVLRDLVDTPVSEGAAESPARPDEGGQDAWAAERTDLLARVDHLERELAVARMQAEQVPLLQTAVAEAHTQLQEGEQARRVAAALDALGLDVDQLPDLIAAAQRLAALETDDLPQLQADAAALERVTREELPALRARIAELEAPRTEFDLEHLRDAAQRLAALETEDLPRLQADADLLERITREELPVLRARIAELEAPRTEPDLEHLRDAARRLEELEADELPALREALAAREAERAAAAAAAHDAAQRVGELERALVDASARTLVAETERSSARPAVEQDHSDETEASPIASLPAEQTWLLEELVPLGIVTTHPDGRLLRANIHGAHACGYDSVEALMADGRLPQPIYDIVGDDLESARRFEICLQAGTAPAAHWVAGARLPTAPEDTSITWWLADVTSRQPAALRDDARVQALSEVLDVAATECAVVVDAAATAPPLGPRRLEAAAPDAPVRQQALARAQVMLAQASALGRRPAAAPVTDLRDRLTSLGSLLERVVGDDVTWSLDLPGAPVHACVTAAALERCITTIVTIARDALPLGGRLTLSLGEAHGAGDSAGAVRRATATVVLEVQGYGRHLLVLPPALVDAAAALGGEIDVTSEDALTLRVALRLPRAFVVTRAA